MYFILCYYTQNVFICNNVFLVFAANGVGGWLSVCIIWTRYVVIVHIYKIISFCCPEDLTFPRYICIKQCTPTNKRNEKHVIRKIKTTPFFYIGKFLDFKQCLYKFVFNFLVERSFLSNFNTDYCNRKVDSLNSCYFRKIKTSIETHKKKPLKSIVIMFGNFNKKALLFVKHL